MAAAQTARTCTVAVPQQLTADSLQYDASYLGEALQTQTPRCQVRTKAVDLSDGIRHFNVCLVIRLLLTTYCGWHMLLTENRGQGHSSCLRHRTNTTSTE